MYFIPQQSPQELESNDNVLKQDPFKALVVPRPIGWISTTSAQGINNLAPYSFFNAVSDKPHMVMFSSGGYKDTLSNIIETEEFVCNYVSSDFKLAMNMSGHSYAPDIDEIKEIGLKTEPSKTIKVPRIDKCWAALECRLWKIIDLPTIEDNKNAYKMVIGQVSCIYIKDSFIVDGKVASYKAPPLARMGYADYTYGDNCFTMLRPDK